MARFRIMNDASPRNVCTGGRHVESPYYYLRRTSDFSPLNLEELSATISATSAFLLVNASGLTRYFLKIYE